MAKKQQSLFGAGDASIIQAATKAAFADAPVSLAPVFKGISAGYQNMLNSSNSMFAYWLGFKRALEWLFLEDKK